jgi:hypothetical protein
MKIICEKGFYKFFPTDIAEVRRFGDKYGVPLVQCDDFFTFEVLAELPNYSIKGQPYSGVILALETWAGKREEVMTANGLTYDQSRKGLTLSSSPSLFTKKMSYDISGNYIVMSNLPQAYFYDNGGLITGFHGWVNVDVMKFNIERFFYAEVD